MQKFYPIQRIALRAFNNGLLFRAREGEATLRLMDESATPQRMSASAEK